MILRFLKSHIPRFIHYIDNTELNSGSGGDVIATDDIAGVKHQKVKVEFGGDDSATQVDAANPLPVDSSGQTQPISAASLPLPTGAATSALQLADGHNVTVDNGAAAAAVNIQDGGNTITIDGTVDAGTGFPSVATDAGAHGASQTGIRAMGTDGTNDQQILVAADGTVTVDGSGVTQPISAASLPLPTGAATSALQLADGHNVTVDNGAAGAAVNIQDGGNVITIDGTLSTVTTVTTLSTLTGGSVADDGPDSENPVKVGARARATISGDVVVTANDRVDLITDVDRTLLTKPFAPSDDYVDGNASATDTTSTAVIAAVASVFVYVTSVVLTNSSSTDTTAEILSGAVGKGEYTVPANGGMIFCPPTPLTPSAVNTAWNFQASTGVTTLFCSMTGYQTRA